MGALALAAGLLLSGCGGPPTATFGPGIAWGSDEQAGRAPAASAGQAGESGAALPAGGVDRMQRLAQSIVDVLPPGDKERALYENFLVGARSLPQPTKKDEAAVKQQKLF